MKILVACSPGEQRILAWGPDGATDAAIHRPWSPDRVGELWRGRVTARVPAMAGMFVALDQMSGFLPDSAGGRGLTVGDVVGVRIARAALGSKGPRLTALLTQEEQAALAVSGTGRIREGLHPAIDLARRLDAPILADDPAMAAWLGGTAVAKAFDGDAEDTWASLDDFTIDLPGGLRLTIEPTAALTAIDCDLGGAAAERSGKARTHVEANLAFIPRIAQQIRLRNLSGAILVDLAGVPARKRSTFAERFHAALAADPLQPRLLGFTALGFAEIARPRVRPPLHESLDREHGLALTLLSRAERAHPDGQVELVVNPAIATWLKVDVAAQLDWRRRTGQDLRVREDWSIARGDLVLEPLRHA